MNQSLAYDIAAVMPAAVATGLFVSVCTIQAPDGNYSSTGQPSGTYADVSGLVGIQCMDAPEREGSILAGEGRAAYQITSEALRHVLLDDYYPALSPATNWGDVGWRAAVDGVTFDIRGVENDSQLTQTRLKLAKVTT